MIIKYKLETIEKLNRAIADYYGYCDCDCRRRITIAGQKRLRTKHESGYFGSLGGRNELNLGIGHSTSTVSPVRFVTSMSVL